MADLYTTLTPRLVVDDAQAALAYYRDVFDAEPGMTIRDPSGRVVHAEMDLFGLRMSLTEADGDIARGPHALGGTPVILTIHGGDPDVLADRAVEHGGTVVFAVEDRPYGMRDGRVRDPFGHEWLVSKTLESLTEEELTARVGQM